MSNAKVRKLNTLSVDVLKEYLHYDPLTGLFTWIKASGSRAKVGNIAGHLKNGYIVIDINNKKYAAHRLAWLYIYGTMPNDLIDHKNSVKSDNRIDNLRQSNHQQNNCNLREAKSHNKTGFLGVSLKKGTQRFYAQIKSNGEVIGLGYFDTAQEASEVYLEAKRKYHPFSTI